MDPKNIRLTMSQRIIPLLKAINQEIPYQIVIVLIISLSMAIYVTGLIPVFITAILLDFIVRRLLLGFVVGAITFGLTGLIYMTIEDKLVPIINKIKEHYEKESLKVKKQILEDVIDDEILK